MLCQCVHGLLRWSILFLDFATWSCSSLSQQPFLLSVSKATHCGHSHSGTSKQWKVACQCWAARDSTGKEPCETLAEQQRPTAACSISKLHTKFTERNWWIQKTHEFNVIEFMSFMNSYTSEFRSTWIHTCIHIWIHKNHWIHIWIQKNLWIHIWIFMSHGIHTWIQNWH